MAMDDVLTRPKCRGSGDSQLTTLLQRRSLGLHATQAPYIHSLVRERGLPYAQTLIGHTGCVNTVAFSHRDGSLLASGSDDKRVLVWETFDRRRPHRSVQEFQGHSSNVFCTVWAPDNEYLFSSGNDGKILRFDVQRGPGFLQQYTHEDAVHKLSLHPEDSNVFISASHDFTMKLWDTRTGQAPQGSIVGLDAYNSVAFCPTNANFFLSCDGSAVCLWDLRKSFGPDQLPSLEAARQSKSQVLRHYMAVCRHHSGVMFLPEISGLNFNRAGTHFICSVWKAVPLLYQLASETPLMAFHGQWYSNKVTQKTASFAGDEDQFVMCGSDDWGVYLWSIDDAKRQTDDSSYRLRLSQSKRRPIAQGVHGNPCCKPKSRRHVQTNAEFVVENPIHVLRGHQSIVNNVDWNAREPMIASAGVEKCIRLWSPWPMEDQDKAPDPVRIPRKDFTPTRMTILQEALGHDSDEQQSESKTFELFDFYTARMESDTELSSSVFESDQSPGPPVAGSDASDGDQDEWQDESDSASEASDRVPQRGHSQVRTHKFFSSSDEEDGPVAYQPLESDPDSPPTTASRPRRPSLSLSFDTATLLQQLSDPLALPLPLSQLYVSPPSTRAGGTSSQRPSPRSLMSTRRDMEAPADRRNKRPSSLPTGRQESHGVDDVKKKPLLRKRTSGRQAQSHHGLSPRCPTSLSQCLAEPVEENSGTPASPSLLLQYLDTMTSTPRHPSEPSSDFSSVGEHPQDSRGTTTTSPDCVTYNRSFTSDDLPPLEAADTSDIPGQAVDDPNSQDLSDLSDDLLGRKRPRSTGSPDSVSRPTKRCE